MPSKEYQRKWRAEHKEQCKEYDEKYRATHKELRKERNEKWRRTHQKQINERQRAYYGNHKDQILGMEKRWREQNPDKRVAERVIEHGMRRGRNDFPLASECELCPEDDKRIDSLDHHHPDYNYPEIYVTACRECHNIVNRGRLI